MATATLFLLLAIWMQELAIIGIDEAAALGAGLLAVSAVVLLRYRRVAQGAPSLSATLAAHARRIDVSVQSGPVRRIAPTRH